MQQLGGEPGTGRSKGKAGEPVEQLLADGQVHVVAGGPGVDGEAEG